MLKIRIVTWGGGGGEKKKSLGFRGILRLE